MTESEARNVRDHALAAVRSLSRALAQISEDRVPAAEYAAVKRGVGLSIGKIQTELLDPVYELHPDLDHLAQR